MAKLILIRGLPGSGKSTYAQKFMAIHYEADQFFELADGTYKFDVNLIKVAHEWCYANAVRALRRGYDVVVSNTFTQLWELNRYLELRHLMKDDSLEIQIIEMKTQYQNIHGVPNEKLQQMADRWEDISQACIDRGMNLTRVTE